jgi:hypothetical protein
MFLDMWMVVVTVRDVGLGVLSNADVWLGYEPGTFWRLTMESSVVG